jgi:hypothetical protein
MTDAAAYPRCKHGRAIFERCTECEADMKAGKHGGFDPATPSSKTVNAITRFLIGKVAMPDHPATCLNPAGRDGFTITEAHVDGDTIYVRGADTMWFGQRSLLAIRLPDETRADPAHQHAYGTDATTGEAVCICSAVKTT